MQDKIKIELTKKKIDFINKSVDDLFIKLDIMTKNERMAYFKEMCPENNLNFEKEINGKVYKVNAYFNEESNQTVLNQISTIIEKNLDSSVVKKV